MEAYNEKVTYENPFLSLKIFKSKRSKDGIGRWHYHKEIEVLVILEGKLDVYVGDEMYPLQEGDVVVMGSNELHRDRSFNGNLNYIVLQFDIGQYFDGSTLPYLKYFSETTLPLSRLNYMFNEKEAKASVYHAANQIYEESTAKREGYEIAISIWIKQILLTLVRYDSQKMLIQNNSGDFLRLKPVLDYIDENVCTKIHVEEAAKVANISYYYFVKYFKKTLGMSFLDYVNLKKIKRAEQLLLTQDISVAQVGEEIGMPNMAHFYKIFKKFNQCSPNEFRKKLS